MPFDLAGVLAAVALQSSQGSLTIPMLSGSVVLSLCVGAVGFGVLKSKVEATDKAFPEFRKDMDRCFDEVDRRAEDNAREINRRLDALGREVSAMGATLTAIQRQGEHK